MTLGSDCEQLRELMLKQYDTGTQHLLLDCSKVTTVDSFGLGEMVAAYSAITRRGGAMKLLAPTKRLIELLKTTRLDILLEGYSDEHSAIASFTSLANAKAQQSLSEFLK